MNTSVFSIQEGINLVILKSLAHLPFFFNHRQIRSIGLLFAFNSFVFGHWVTRIPDVKASLGLTDAQLGMALLGAPVGAIVMLPIAGWYISRLGMGKATGIASFLHLLSPILMGLADSQFWLMMSLVYFGVTNALMDVAMNAAAAQQERRSTRHIMSTCHGMWSLGAMLGAASGSLVLGLSVPYPAHLEVASLVTVFLFLVLSRDIWQLSDEVRPNEKIFALPNKTLLGLAAIAFCVMMSEGAIADWSAIFMKEGRQASLMLTGIAYACFSAAMAIGRLLGDAIIPRLGKKTVAIWGGWISLTGLSLLIFIPIPGMSLVGFTLAGLGYACLVPVIFSSAANEPGYAAGTGIAAVTTIAYTGFLVGPPIIGFLSEMTQITHAFILLWLMALIIVLLARVVRFN